MFRNILFVAILAAIVLLPTVSVRAEPVDDRSAESAARFAFAQLNGTSGPLAVASVTAISEPDGLVLGWAFRVEPRGFLVVSGDTDLPALIAYSLRNDLPTAGPREHEFFAFLRTDLDRRLKKVALLTSDALESRRHEWAQLLDGDPGKAVKRAPTQWPPAGSTATGGWLESNWHQNAPYNNACPMDPVTATRSLAGCPAVAMAQIMNYHWATNNTVFDDGDDYDHSYAGRNYWIDDDHAAQDFPPFPNLSTALGELEADYAAQIPADDAGSAALTFACGVAAQQVYTSSASGTFGVAQADQAYQKFAVNGAELFYDTDPNLYTRLSQNMKSGLPAHLAVVNEDWTSGHNVVADGYNSDDYYHLNFGWGGSANGWYLLPDEIPYGLTVVDGVIVDINPSGIIFKDGFEGGITGYWSLVVE